jgi:protein-S-isoprenylcysteine O-methyltransferase Ste14
VIRNEPSLISDPDQHRQPERINAGRLTLLLLTTPLILAVFMFLPAGTIDWPKGWLFLVALIATSPVFAVFLQRVNPEVIVARSRFHTGTKRWDKILLGLLIPAFMLIPTVAALDDARFHWFPLPWWACGLGYALFFVGMSLMTWVEAVNRFAEVTVRIQTERGQTVIDTGPYAIVRHPLYSASLPFIMGMALALGSLWALVPAGLSWLLLVLRTQWEDETLQTELPGYKEYMERVRYKLIPGVW